MNALSLILISALCLSTACKKKGIASNRAPQGQDGSPSGPTVAKGEWQGQRDQIDPALGKMKTID